MRLSHVTDHNVVQNSKRINLFEYASYDFSPVDPEGSGTVLYNTLLIKGNFVLCVTEAKRTKQCCIAFF